MELNNKLLKPFLVILVCLSFLKTNAQDLQADNILLFQRDNGGWFKQFRGKAFSYNVTFSVADKAEIAEEVQQGEATIDNGATTKEIRYLAKAYKTYGTQKYLTAAEKGVRYLLEAQYKNGGWPQYYPDKNLYRAEITFNDNAMINTLNVLRDITLGKNDLDVISRDLVKPCEDAINKGIDCIIKTQIVVNGVYTAWCQQYDQNTLKPEKARAYELPSISGAESTYIVEFLMEIPNPSKEVKNAINSAVHWFQNVEIKGYKVVETPAPGTTKGYNRELVADPNSTIWARYYEIGTNRPFFCDRDGIKKYSLKDIGYERRNGYSWYGVWPKQLLAKKYPEWVKVNEK